MKITCAVWIITRYEACVAKSRRCSTKRVTTDCSIVSRGKIKKKITLHCSNGIMNFSVGIGILGCCVQFLGSLV